MNRTEELEAQVLRLSVTIDNMKARMARLEGPSAEAQEGLAKKSSRRRFLRIGAAAAVGSLGWVAAKAVPAYAITGGPVLLGMANLAENPTLITADGGSPPTQVLAAADANFSGAALTTAGGFFGTVQGLGAGTGVHEGVDGWAQGASAFGVYGLTDAGTGVVGESATGIGLYARRTGRIRQDGLAAPGTPVYSPNDFEFVRDSNGVPYVSVAAGAWKQVATTDLGLHLFPNPRRVWDGFAQPTAAGVYGPVDATMTMYPTVAASGVPAGAQAAWCAVMSYESGVMTIFPDLTTEPLVSNWSCGVSGGTLSIFYMFVPLSTAGKFKFHSFSTGHRFFDVWGYLM